MDTALTLDPALPRRRGVEEAIRRAVESGALAVGARLPSARELAEDLGVARGTVVSAVDDLVAEGLLEARPRSGVFVARGGGSRVTSAPAAPPRPPRLDLRPGRPESGSFPATRWAAALRRAATALPAEPDDDGSGSALLRSELAGYLARARGVLAAPDSIVVTSGYRAVSVLAMVLRTRGASHVAIEDPALPGSDGAWRAFGWRVTDLPVDALGACTDALDASMDVAVLTPAHQFPLGGALDAQRRRDAVEWARRAGGLIVEDDYDGEFRFDRRPVAALQRSDPERVVYVGSASKTLDTRLRLGWMIVPHQLVAPLRRATLTLTGGVPLLDQLALAELIRSGDFERHIRRQRREYARRRAHLQRAAADAGLSLPGIPAGLQAVIPLPDAPAGPGPAAGDDGVVRVGGLVTHALHRYTRSLARPPAIVAGFSTPSRAAFEPAIDALIGAIAARDAP
ncbi:MAG: PLP-dependent aminotransferase family protein [Leifsonia sp.]|uniref:MocR-like pyridoxine biosynthesis transcription factor PdxR n=1 Tax=Leifsonia sp. TaxID=1870902 RepID=UPI003F81C84A